LFARRSGPRGRGFKSRHSDHVAADDISFAATFLFKSHFSLILSQLLSKSNPLRWASIWFYPGTENSDPLMTLRPRRRGLRIVRLLRRSFFLYQTHFVGFRFVFDCISMLVSSVKKPANHVNRWFVGSFVILAAKKSNFA